MSDLPAIGATVEPVFPISHRIGWNARGVVTEHIAADPVRYPKGAAIVDFTVATVGGSEVEQAIVEAHEIIDVAAAERAWKRAGL